MNIPAPEPWTDGGLRGFIYRFTEIGDAIPMHEHDETTAHMTFVLLGLLRAKGPANLWEGTHGPGSMISFDPGQWHELSAVTPGTLILNLLKNPA